MLPQVQQRMNDVKVKDVEIFDWKKKAAEAESKLKQQESLLESVMSERNLCSKNIAEAQVRPFPKKLISYMTTVIVLFSLIPLVFLHSLYRTRS